MKSGGAIDQLEKYIAMEIVDFRGDTEYFNTIMALVKKIQDGNITTAITDLNTARSARSTAVRSLLSENENSQKIDAILVDIAAGK